MNTSTTALRLFIAVELPPAVRATLLSARQQIERQSPLAVRWVDPEGTHLTLKFLGAVPSTEVAAITGAMEAAARQHHPFTLTTTQLGVFPNRRAPRVVWLGVSGAVEALGALRADVERLVAPLGYPTEQRPFSPHLTLGRTHKDATGAERALIGSVVAQTASPGPVTWQVGEIALMRSELGRHGAHYTALTRIGLGNTETHNEIGRKQ
jgi:2'-5' RNA ligase